MAALLFIAPLSLIACSALVAFLSVRLGRGTGDALRARQAVQPLAHELPYWSFFDDDAGVGVSVQVDGSYASLYRLSGLDADCNDNETLNQTNHILHGALQNLPPGGVVQLLHETDGNIEDAITGYRRAVAPRTPLGLGLVAAKEKSLRRTANLRRNRLLLSVAIPPPGVSETARALGFRRRFPSLGPADHEASLRRLRSLREQVARGLTAAGLAARPLVAREIRQVVYQLMNPTRALAVPHPFGEDEAGSRSDSVPWSPDQTAREQLIFSGITELRHHLVLDGTLQRVITLKTLGTSTHPGLLQALQERLPFHCRIAFAVEVLDSLATLDALKRKRDQAHLLATLREKRNQEAEAQEHDINELIERSLGSAIRMTQASLTIVLSVAADHTDAEAVLERQTTEVLRVVSSLAGAQAMVDEYNQLDELLATLPGNARHGRRFRKCTSENVAHMLPVWQAWQGCAAPVLIVQNGRGNLVGIDPFDPQLDNPNAFMAGASGSGKSSTTNYLLLNLLASGTGALIVDVGGSYKRLMEIFGGHYFAVDASANQGLNPFFAHEDIVLPDGGLEKHRAQILYAVLERMAQGRSRPELGNAERAVLGAALQKTYRTITDRTPVLCDLVSVLRGFATEDPEDAVIARSLARELRSWVEEPACALINRPSTLSLTTSLAAFDLKGLDATPELQAVVMLILSGVIWNLVMRDPTEKKIVVFDEVWRLLESPSSARMIAELYRTSRKYSCSILTLSQSVDDFLSSPVSGALVQNSAATYLLRHRRGHEGVAQQFKLNEQELYVFQGLEMRRGVFTEALVLFGDHHFLARIALSPLEYWIATTHPADLALERRVRAEHPELSRLESLALLAEQHPRGAESADKARA